VKVNIGTHIGVGCRGSNGGLKDEIRNKTVDLQGDTSKNSYGRYKDLAGYLCFPEQKATHPS